MRNTFSNPLLPLTLALFLLSAPSLSAKPSESESAPVPLTLEDKLKAAEAGNVEAMESAAFSYQYGIGADANEEKAIEWLGRASAAGSATAASALGDIYGSRRDYQQSFTWYSKAAESKHPWAIFRLGIMYQNGLNVQRNANQARRLFEEAAHLGNADAQHYVALLYFSGDIFPRNRMAAYAWASIAASKEDRFKKTLEVIERELTPDELLRAQDLALQIDSAFGR